LLKVYIREKRERKTSRTGKKKKKKETGFKSFQKGACQGFGLLKNTTCTQGKVEIF
jgi:hypothetical protein